MPRRESRNHVMYLRDMRNACAEIRKLIGGVSLDEYLQNNVLRWAIERQLTIVGEALYQMHEFFPEVAIRIPEANLIIRFRHVLVHGYSIVNNETVWDVAQNRLPELQDVVKKMLEEEEEP